jgi:hypothetical protein
MITEKKKFHYCQKEPRQTKKATSSSQAAIITSRIRCHQGSSKKSTSSSSQGTILIININ